MTFRLLQWEDQLIQAIHRYGGFITDEYVTDFYLNSRDKSKPPPKSSRYLRRRKQLLRDNRILKEVCPDHIKGYVLGLEGARILAGREGKKLSGTDPFAYRKRSPHYVHHEWREAQAHMRFEKACHDHKRIKLYNYRHDLELRRFPIMVECFDPERKEYYKRKIVPDSIADLDFRMREYSFPVEIDMGTRFDPNITKHKLIPHMLYHKAVQNDFWGREPNIWLWVTTGKTRLRHLKDKVEATAKALNKPSYAHQIILTTWKQFTPANIFKNPIWVQAGRSDTHTLFSCCEYAKNM